MRAHTVALALATSLTAIPAFAHRLDEYLQGTILSVEKNRLEAQMTLTPGVAVFPQLILEIDRDADGVISPAEQQAYAQSVLRDLSLSVDGRPLEPRLVTARFPAVRDMQEGLGGIQLEFEADLPSGSGGGRKLTLENRHHSAISAYQVNCLVSRDPTIRVLAQNRNYSQSLYELDFDQTGPSGLPGFAWQATAQQLLGTAALLLLAWLARRFISPPPAEAPPALGEGADRPRSA